MIYLKQIPNSTLSFWHKFPSLSTLAKFIEFKHFETLYTGNILRQIDGDTTASDVAFPEVLQPNVEIYKKEVRRAMAQ